ncbi:MAG: sigma-70 family RNA polymerase sigma factor [Prevotella sp.]|nr:sigma-70 family RNA polymerase sigma factor [Prevotella sp.]
MVTVSSENREIIGRAYQEVRPDIFSIFRQACIAEDTCEDLVQEVFVKIMGLDIIIASQLKALAVTIAYQKRTDYLRHRVYMNKVRNEGSWQMERSYTNQEAEVNDILQTEMKVIRCMSELDSRTYILSRFEEKSADEIALTLNLSKRAVESRIYRTRQMVREHVRKVIGF